MIQRIQSIFLLLASLAGFGQFTVPYMNSNAVTLPAFADGQLNPMDNIGLLGLSVLGGTISLIAIFLYKNRALQGRITGGALLSSVLLIALLAFTIFQTQQQLPAESSASFNAGVGLPVLSALFQWLAGRNIRKDENLVRSMDRLR